MLGYYIGAPRKLTYYADILKYYRALAKATPRVKVETIGKTDEGREHGHRLGLVGREHQEPRAEHARTCAKLADPRGLADAADRAAHRDDQAAVPLDGRPAQRRDGPVRNADGARLPARDRDVAAHHADPQQRRSSRSRRRPSRTGAIATSTGSIAASMTRRRKRRRVAVRAGGGGRGGGARLPYWGKYVYHDNNRDFNVSLMSMRAMFDWYMSSHAPIVHDLHEAAAADVHLQRQRAAESEPRSDPLVRAAVLLELRSRADDQVGHAGRLDAQLHGRLVAGLPRLDGLQPQRHDADVRDAVGQRGHRPRRRPAARQRRTRRGRRRTPAAGGAAATAGARPLAARHGGRWRREAGRRGREVAAVADAAGGGGAAGGGKPAAPARPRQCGELGGAATQQAAAQPFGSSGRGGGRGAGGAGAKPRAGRRTPGGFAPRPGQSEHAPVVPGHPGAARAPRRPSRGATTRTTWRRACSRRCSSRRRSRISSSRTSTARRRTRSTPGKTQPPYGYVIPPKRDMTQASRRSSASCACRASKSGAAAAEFKIGDDDVSGRLVRREARSAVRPAREDAARKAGLSGRRRCRPTTTAAGRRASRSLVDVKEIDRQGDPRRERAARRRSSSPRARSPARAAAGLAVAHYGSNNMIVVPLQAEERRR